MKEILINKRKIGVEHPVYIVAEMSANHCGSLERAKEMVWAAKECGADAIKLQTYTADTITLNHNSADFTIPRSNPWAQQNTLYQLYEQAHTPWDWHALLYQEASKAEIDIFSSPFDETAVDFLQDLNSCAYKIASPEITHIPLLEKVAKTGRPVIISTGVALLEDIELAIQTLQNEGCSDIVILKCTSSYPTPFSAMNLKTIVDMQQRFNYLVGLSDHSTGTVASVVATTLGAVLIEKHFILDKRDNSVDAFFSLDKNEFTKMVKDIRDAEAAIGNVNYDIDNEIKKNFWGRRSLYICKEIHQGEIISEEHIKCVRPFYGLHPKYKSKLIGKKAKRSLKFGDRISLDDFGE